MKRSTGCLADRVEQDLRAFDVRRHELRRAGLDRLLHVRLGGGVDDHVHFRDDLADEIRVADVAVHERVALVRRDRREVVHAARVGERVEGDDLVRRRLQDVADEVRRDESRAAGDENAFRLHGPEAYDVTRLSCRDELRRPLHPAQRLHVGRRHADEPPASHRLLRALHARRRGQAEVGPGAGPSVLADYARGKYRRHEAVLALALPGQAFRERPGIDAVGFKLMYSQLSTDQQAAHARAVAEARPDHPPDPPERARRRPLEGGRAPRGRVGCTHAKARTSSRCASISTRTRCCGG